MATRAVLVVGGSADLDGFVMVLAGGAIRVLIHPLFSQGSQALGLDLLWRDVAVSQRQAGNTKQTSSKESAQCDFIIHDYHR